MHEAFKKVCKIHSESPAGGILVFVTGRQEVEFLCRKLKAKYPHNSNFIHSNKSHKKDSIKNKSSHNTNNSKKLLMSEKMPTINLDESVFYVYSQYSSLKFNYYSVMTSIHWKLKEF
jgi:HrpA-like RNA helicase